MNEKQIKKISKFLSLILRHSPETINLSLDNNGWADVDELLSKANKNNMSFDRQTLEIVVATNDKKRFSFNEDRSKIRASQGHSISVDLEMNPTQPPEYLYHGTVAKFIKSIQIGGLKKMNRNHVHLSEEKDTAIKVGSRRGKPSILTIRSGEMNRDKFSFYLSKNGVWLTNDVPAQYIEFRN